MVSARTARATASSGSISVFIGSHRPGERWLDQVLNPDLLAIRHQSARDSHTREYVSTGNMGTAWALRCLLCSTAQAEHAHVDTGLRASGDWLRLPSFFCRTALPGWTQSLFALGAARVAACCKPVEGAIPTMVPLCGRALMRRRECRRVCTRTGVLVSEGGVTGRWLVHSVQIAILRTGHQLIDWDDGRIPNI